MPANDQRPVFTYETRVTLTAEQDQMLSEYAVRFGQVERTLFVDVQKGGEVSRLKCEYLERFDITARQFNAARIQVEGKIKAIRELIPVQMDLQRKIRKARKVVARPQAIHGTSKLHQKWRRLARLELWKPTAKPATSISASDPGSCSTRSFTSRRMGMNRTRSGSRHGRRPARTSSS
jgi:hypothetical protein